MNTGVERVLITPRWKDLCQAAILEPDLNKLPERSSSAEAALVARARELFYTIGDDGEEGESLDYAMCILQALRGSLSPRNPSRRNSLTIDTAVPEAHKGEAE